MGSGVGAPPLPAADPDDHASIRAMLDEADTRLATIRQYALWDFVGGLPSFGGLVGIAASAIALLLIAAQVLLLGGFGNLALIEPTLIASLLAVVFVQFRNRRGRRLLDRGELVLCAVVERRAPNDDGVFDAAVLFSLDRTARTDPRRLIAAADRVASDTLDTAWRRKRPVAVAGMASTFVAVAQTSAERLEGVDSLLWLCLVDPVAPASSPIRLVQVEAIWPKTMIELSEHFPAHEDA